MKQKPVCGTGEMLEHLKRKKKAQPTAGLIQNLGEKISGM